MSPYQTLRYGTNSQLDLQIPAGTVVAQGGSPRGTPLDDVVAAVAASLVDPIDYPAVGEATVPSDRVAVAVDRGLPQVASVVAGVLQPLVESGVAPGNITLVLAEDDRDPSAVTQKLPASYRDQVVVSLHTPRDRQSLAYLAASSDAQPIYLNRIICDADFVIPVGCVRVGGVLDEMGVPGGVFPTFADAETRDRFLTPSSSLIGTELQRRGREMEEAAWLLGARLTVQVIPGNGDQLLHVLAGDLDSVAPECRRLCQTAWSFDVPCEAELVIAAVEGGPSQQTWDNVVRALQAAMRIVRVPDGSVAICSDLEHRPGPALMRVMGADTLDKAERDAFQQHSPDAQAAVQLVQSLRHARVYLLSRLQEDVVQALGLAYVTHPHEINNLCQRHDSCTLLANAQFAWPSLHGMTVSPERVV